MGNMMGAGPASGPPIQKTQLIRIITKARKLILRRMLEAKRSNIQERLTWYKVDADKYKETITRFAMGQPQIVQAALAEICEQQNISMASLGPSIQAHMMDPDVQVILGLMQTIAGDMCENQPFPEEFDKEKFKEILRVQTEEVQKYVVTDQMSSMVAQTASTDEIYRIYGIDEVQLGALAIKHENDPDPELKELKDKWNEATRMDLVLNSRPSGHEHGPNCQHGHSH